MIRKDSTVEHSLFKILMFQFTIDEIGNLSLQVNKLKAIEELY